MKKIMILLFALALLTSVFADVITIGTGTSSTYEPIASYYGFHRSAAIYTAGQVGGSGTITTIAYKAYNTNATVIPIKVYMKMTTAASLAPAASWPTLITGLTPLYDGSFSGTTAGEWKTITLDTPFEYTGNNLEILIESNYGGGGISGPSMVLFHCRKPKPIHSRGQHCPNYSGWHSKRYLPNIQLDISGYTTFPPSFAVTPTSVAFGNVNMNTTTAYTNVTVFNNGAGTLNVTSADLGGADAARFLLDMNSNPLPWALTAGASKIVKVAFNPTAEAGYSAYLRFGSDRRADHDVALTGTGVDPAISTFPTTYDFGTTSSDAFPPFNWTRYSGVLADPTVMGAEGTGYWRQDDWLNNTSIANKASRLRIYSTWNGWLVSPPINVPANDYEVMFDVAYMYYSSNNPPNTTGTDDKFAVLIGDGTSWTTANVVRQWDNAGSPYILNNIPPAGITVSLSLGAAGTKYVAFYAGSTTSNADNDLMVDNITFRQTPSNPIFSLSPNITSWDFGQTMINTAATKQFTITNTGGGTLSLSSVVASGTYYSISVDPTDMELTAGESTTFTVQYLPTIAGVDQAGTLTINDSRAVTTVALTGTCFDPTITSFPYNQNFDDTWSGTPAAPLGWTVINANNDSYLWSQADTYITPRSAPYTAHGMGNTNDYLITPPIDLTGVDVRMKWWDIVESASQANSYKVLLSTTDTQIASFTVELGDITCTNTAWTEHTINLNGYTGTVYLAFYQYASAATYYGFGIDDFLLEEIPAGPAISVSPTTWDFGDVDIVAPATKVFTITNTGAADLILSNVTANGAYYSITAQPDMTVTPGNSTTFTVQFAPTEVGGPYTGDITINDNRAQTVITLTGSAIARPAGSTCGNPYDVTLPLVNFAGDTALYGDDYDSGWVTPSSNYLTGDDMVLRFTLALPSTLSGSISTTASWPGLLIVGQEPNATTPAPLLASATTSGTSATMTPVVLPAGTYFAIVSSYTSPQSIPFTLNLSAVPLSNDPEPSEYPTAFTFGTTATTSIQLTWTGSVGTQLPTKYLILAKKAGGTFATVTDGVPVANDAVWTDNNAAVNVAHVVGANSYTFTGLTEATSYDFVIYPYTNELGNTNYKTDGTPPAFTKATVDPTQPLPYVQNFDSGTTLAAINWTGDMSISSTHGANGTNGLYRNLWSSATTTNVVSCPIGPMVANAELKFDYRIVNYTGYPATATAITTDTIVAQVSTDGGLTFTTVYTINQGNHVTSTAFATVIVPLAAYSTGNIKVKLLSTWGAGDYYVDIDNVVVRVTPVGPPDAVTLSYPANNATDLPKNGFNLTWAPAATGGTPTSYTVYMATSAEGIYDEEFFNGITGTSFNPVTDGLMTFNYEDRWFWTVEAINADGSAAVDPPISFTIQADPAVTVPYLENFDALTVGAMPANMTIFGTQPWQAAANIAPHSMPNCAVVYYNSYNDKNEWMITPPIKMVANQLYTISFALKAPGWEGVPEALAMHFGTAPTIAAMTANTPLYDDNNLTQADWTIIQKPFTPSTTGNYYFGWHAYSDADNDYVAVDDISIFIPAALDLAVTGLGGETVGFVGSPVTNTVTIANVGASAISSYTVYLKNAVGDAVLAQETINVALPAAGSADHDLSWTPTTAGTISVYAEVVATGDLVTANNVSAAMDVTVYPASMKLLYVGDPATNWVTSGYPFNMYWEDFVAESVYLASEIQASAGTIKAISYFNNFPTEETKQVQVWMQNTSQADASAGWLPWANYTLVFDGMVHFPVGVNEINIPITPFTYTGGNLAIRTSRTWEGDYETSNHRFYVTEDLGHPNRTRYYSADSEFVDHTAPEAGNTSSYMPNTLFYVDPATLVLTTDTPVVTVSETSGAVNLDWAVIPYAYSYNVYKSADPYAFGTIPETTIYTNTYSYTPLVGETKAFYKVASATYRDYVRGVMAQDYVSKKNAGDLKQVETIQVPKLRNRKTQQ